MGSFESHKRLFTEFRRDAENPGLYEGTRVEAFFLSAYHLIEACCARERVHVNKHQRVRSTLEENQFIFGDDTERVWRSFQLIENQKRPKFAYGMAWTEKDMEDVVQAYNELLGICAGRLE